MPELPEVETTCRALRKILQGARLTSIIAHRDKLRFAVPKNLKSVEGHKVKSITRRAKYILINLDNDDTLIVHLGMSGRLFKRDDDYEPSKHDHIVIETNKDDTVIFRDPRRFGLIDLVKTADVENHRLIKNIGPEPLGDALQTKDFHNALSRRKVSIKAALLDQKLIAGLGNIYVCEALYETHILPTRIAADVTAKEAPLLLKSIRAVLEKSIDWGGSTLKDYASADGELGGFQKHFKVYNHTGQDCPRRGCRGVIQQITQNGRSSFFCPVCQH